MVIIDKYFVNEVYKDRSYELLTVYQYILLIYCTDTSSNMSTFSSQF